MPSTDHNVSNIYELRLLSKKYGSIVSVRTENSEESVILLYRIFQINVNVFVKPN